MGGAILGGVLLGPLGALFGAQIGNAMGAASERRKQYEEELLSRGVTLDMMELAQSVGKDLAEGVEALKICAAAAESVSARYAQLEAGVAEAYNDAMAAVQAGDDAAARRHLHEKAARTKKLAALGQEVTEASQRLKSTRRAVQALEERVQEVESLIQRSMSITASERVQGLSPLPSSAESYIDPLEQRFRDLEGR
jgi:phage shock protein A